MKVKSSKQSPDGFSSFHLCPPYFLYCNQRRSGKSTNATIAIIPTYSYAFDVVAVATANLITRRSESSVNQSNIVMASTFVGPVDVADPSTGKLRRSVLFAKSKVR